MIGFAAALAVAAASLTTPSASASGAAVDRATLSNGLRIIAVRDAIAPVVTVEMTYLVGAVDTPPGFPGMAHAQEHMAFRGLAGLSADQVGGIFAELGGDANAFTQPTTTTFRTTLPAADLAAWLSPRISAYGEPAVPLSPAKEAPMHGWLPNLRRNPRRKGDLMFRRFSPRAREVIISAQQEARALQHGFIGTEHILLGLLRDRDGVAGRALHVLGISPQAAREQVLEIIGEGKA